MNVCCRKTRENMERLTRQLANLSDERRRYEDLRKKLQRMEEQMSTSNTSIETLTNQLYELKNQHRKAQFDLEASRKKEADLIRQLQLTENTANALKLKAESAEVYKQRLHHATEICEQIQEKRMTMGENFKTIVGMCKQYKTDYDLAIAECQKIKEEKETVVNRQKLCKRHVPTLLRLVDELAPLAGNLPYQTRRRIDTFASQEVRTRLLGGIKEYDSDEEMANDVEALILGGVKATAPRRQPAASKKKEPGAGIKRGRRPQQQHNVEENEKLLNTMIQQKLSKPDSDPNLPMSGIAGGHWTIHGKKGPTVREQQAEMIPVKERIAQMKAEEITNESKTIIPINVKQLSNNIEVHHMPVYKGEKVQLGDEMIHESAIIKETPPNNTNKFAVKRKAEAEGHAPVKLKMEPDDNNHMEGSNNNLTATTIVPDESGHKLMELTIRELQQFACQLDHFKKCYKIDQQKTSIFEKILEQIKRDPQPVAVAEFGLKCSILIALLNTVGSCLDLYYDEKKNLLHEFMSTALKRAQQIAEFLSDHKENAPEHRLMLLEIVNKFSTALTRNPILM